MLQSSDLPGQDRQGVPSPLNVTESPTALEMTKAVQQLAVELQTERCLNQLGLQLNACVSAFLAAVASPLETIDSTRAQLAQILVDGTFATVRLLWAGCSWLRLPHPHSIDLVHWITWRT
jgi:hypothetical protein